MKKFANMTIGIAVLVGLVCVLSGTPVTAAIVSEDFESAVGVTPPSGWTLVDGGSGSYTNTTGNGGGQGGELDWTGGNTTAPSVYVVEDLTFDATKAFSGSIDFYVVEDGNYSYGNIIFGDVADGLTGASAGEFLNVQLREKTFGNRARIYAGDDSFLFNGDGDNLYEIFTDQWYTGTYSWTPTSGLTGDFSFSWGGTEGPMTVTGYTFDSQKVYIGLGSGDSPVIFDNFSITGTQLIPEPSTVALLAVGGLGLLWRRRRRK